MIHFFVPFVFLFWLASSIGNYKFSLLIQQILSWFSHLIYLSLSLLLFYFCFSLMICPIHSFKNQILLQHLLLCLYKHHLCLCRQQNYLYPCDINIFFLNISVLHDHTKIHTLLFYLIMTLMDQSRLVYS